MSYTCYTDGSAIGNPGPGGWAWVIVQDNNDPLFGSGGSSLTTNNKMELQAVIELLLFINDDFQIQDSIGGVGLFDSKQNHPLSSIDESLVIYTDSMYVKNGITQRISTRRKRDWRRAKGGKMIANLDQWVTLSKLVDQFTSIEWKRTKAHVGNYWNEQVDKRARGEAQKRMQ